MNKYTPPERVQPLLEKQPSLFRFRRALRRADQIVLDKILEMAASAANDHDPNAYTLLEVILMGMMMAEQKNLERLSAQLDQAKCHE